MGVNYSSISLEMAVSDGIDNKVNLVTFYRGAFLLLDREKDSDQAQAQFWNVIIKSRFTASLAQSTKIFTIPTSEKELQRECDLSGVYTSNLLNDLDFYLGKILTLYEAKHLGGPNIFPNFLLHRGTIFGPNKIPNCSTNWMCRRRLSWINGSMSNTRTYFF